jgi:hypothetical protein
MSDDENKREILELAQRMIGPLMPQWGPAPEGSVCLVCKSANIERSHIAAGGAFSGSVRCKDCGHMQSVVSYLGQVCFKVEPLPEPKV